MSDAHQPLRAGDKLSGFCDGAFGRDSYGDKIVEAIGPDWVVVREQAGILAGVPMLAWVEPQCLIRFRTKMY